MQSRNDPKNPPNSATTTTTTTSTATTSTTTSTSTSTLSEESLNNILHLALQLYHGKKCLFVTGAGLSVSSGIPTYRGDSNSIWSNHITEMGTRRMFQSNPLDWYNNFWLQTHHRREYLIAKPNEGHYSIARLSKLCNVRVITQNIDHLHLKTSLSPSRVIEVHGRLGLYKCVNQRKKNPCPYSKTLSIDNIEIMDYMSTNTFKKTNSSKKPSFKNESVSSLSTTIQSSSSTFTIESVPTCPSCCKPILPQALLFDEKYESHDFYQWQKAMEWIGDCDLIVFVGTSFSVGVTAECLSIVQEQNEEYLNEIQEEDNTIEELLSNQDEMNSMTSQNDDRNNCNGNKNNHRIFNNKNNNKNNNRNNINKNNNRNNINNKNNSSNKNGPIINTKRKLMYNFNMRLDEEVKDLDAMYHVIGRSEFTLPLLYEKLVEIGQVNRWITTSIIHNTDPHVGWMKQQQQDDESIIMNDCATFDESSLSTTTTTTVMTTHLVATNIMDTFTTLNHSNPIITNSNPIITNSNPIITNVNTCMNSNSHPNKVMTRTNSRLRMYYYSSQHLSERSNLSLVVNTTSVKTIKRSTNTTTTNTNSTRHVHDSSLPPLRTSTSTTKTTTTKRTFQIKKHLNSPQPHSADTMHGASHHPLPALKKVKTNPSEENKDHGQEEISTI